jgi:CheY-like chemotaxis protein
MLSNRVLLIENDVDTREVTALLLMYGGYEVMVAADLASGIALSGKHRDIDVLLADMYLGNGETGAELIRNLRDNGMCPPAVLTSADEEALVAARLLKVMFLPKPYDRQALFTVVAMARACGG